MSYSLFFKALCIGFVIVLPLGPIALLVIQRSMKHGFLSGVMTAFGSMTVDIFYAVFAGLGVAYASLFLHNHSVIIGTVGACVLAGLGIHIFREKVHESHAKIPKSHLKEYLSGFGIALMNPSAIILYSGVFLYLKGFHDIPRNIFVFETVVGIFLGASLWWFLLSFLVVRLRHKISPKKLGWLNRISGSLLVAFACALFLKIVIF